MQLSKKQVGPFISKLQKIIDKKDIITDQNTIGPYLIDWVGNFHGNSPLMITPRNTEQVSKIAKLCSTENIALVPQGGNTGSVAAGIPDGEIILSLRKMNKIIETNPNDYTITVQSGCILSEIHELSLIHISEPTRPY